MPAKVCVEFFILFRSWVIYKSLKDLVFTHSCFTLLLITQGLSKIKKYPTNSFVDITKKKTCAKFQQKILNTMVVGARQSFQFLRQKAWLLGNNRGLP